MKTILEGVYEKKLTIADRADELVSLLSAKGCSINLNPDKSIGITYQDYDEEIEKINDSIKDMVGELPYSPTLLYNAFALQNNYLLIKLQ